MKKTRLPAEFLLFLIAAAVFSALLIGPRLTGRALSVASHIVISEIQVGGSVANDEFVELYNPTGDAVDLTGWRLRKEGPSPLNLVLSMSGVIAPHGYFLIAHPAYDTASVPEDL